MEINAGDTGEGCRSKITLAVCQNGRVTRFGLGAIRPGESGVRVCGGPRVPGPWAFAFELATVFDRRGGSAADHRERVARGLEYMIETGDVVVINGDRYRATIVRLAGQTRIDLEGQP